MLGVGQSPEKGFDCSGLVVYAHRKVGIVTPRTAKNQYIKEKPVNKPSLKPCDLVFFNIYKKNLSAKGRVPLSPAFHQNHF